MKLLTKNQLLGNLLLLKSREMMAIFDEAMIAAQNDLILRLGDDSLCVHPRVFIRWFHLPNFREVYRSKIPKSIDANKLLMVRGTIVRAEKPRLMEWEVTYQCLSCHGTFASRADLESYNHHPYPTSCGVIRPVGGKKCTSKKFNKISTVSASNSRDYQELKLQEQVQHLNMGALPRSIGVVIMDNLVGVCNAGDDVTVTGLLTYRWGVLAMGEKPELELLLLGSHLTVNNERKNGTSLSDDSTREFTSFWQEYGVETPLLARDAIIRSICPEVYGMRNVKLAIATILAGGVKVRNGANTTRGDSHLLMVGDPGTGKSQLLRFAARLANRSVLTTGVGTTGAGLTATAVRDNSGEWGLEAGALVLADGGACCIDEFSSIDKAELTSIHEAMEQQTLHMAKAGIVCELHTRCSVLAATNPKSKYNPDETISMNLAIASPILSRFDLVMVLQDECDEIWDRAISSFILKERNKGVMNADHLGDDDDAEDDLEQQMLNFHRSAPQTPTTPMTPQMATRMDDSPQRGSFDDDVNSISAGSHSLGMDRSMSSRSGPGGVRHTLTSMMHDPWPLEKLQAYIAWTKATFQPKLSNEARIIGSRYYKRQRQADDQDAARTTTRLAESFARLTQGHAKLMARHIAIVQDAVIAILLLECSSASWILGGTRVPTVRSFFPMDPDAEYAEIEAIILKNLELSHLGTAPAPPTVPTTPMPPPKVSGDHGGIVLSHNGSNETAERTNAPSAFYMRPPGSSSQTNTIYRAPTNPREETAQEASHMAVDEMEHQEPQDPRAASQAYLDNGNMHLEVNQTNGGHNHFQTSSQHRYRGKQDSQALQPQLPAIPMILDDSASQMSGWGVPTTIETHQTQNQNYLSAHAISAPSNYSNQHTNHAYNTTTTSSGMPDLIPLPPGGVDSDFGVWDIQPADKPLQISHTISSSQMDTDEDFIM